MQLGSTGVRWDLPMNLLPGFLSHEMGKERKNTNFYTLHTHSALQAGPSFPGCPPALFHPEQNALEELQAEAGFRK